MKIGIESENVRIAGMTSERTSLRWRDISVEHMAIHKEIFVTAWTCFLKHLDHRASSRVEGAYAALKKWIQVSTGVSNTVCYRLDLALTAERKPSYKLTYFNEVVTLCFSVPQCDENDLTL
ncbi:hypothetical protein PsorP6_006842 [Peronosclerospora sorghi]|uniref:Uncharacterized protein n=1 Tax=Peronosclerospora sorghi TaxID=230839 RepID=A0ACC0W9K3_9STRA|nr:hypothetical protein PsorP6_006842 [Peronosclerospora sorghi]